MNIDFLVQPDVRVGDLMNLAFAEHGLPQELVVVSAFASLRAVLRFKRKVKGISDAGGQVRLVLGVDLEGTSKEVLQEVASWPARVTIVKNRLFGVTFHPKIYLSHWVTRAEIIVGSNNLTDGGLYRNYEAACRITYDLPADAVELAKARGKLARFIEPNGPTAKKLTQPYLAALLALPEIPSEAVARRARAEGIPQRPPSDTFGYEPIPPAPAIPKGVSPSPAVMLPPISAQPSAMSPEASKTDSLAIEVRAHHNGEIFLSVRAVLQNPAFFKWPFNGRTTPKKAGTAPYPQMTPDPVVDIVVYGASTTPVMRLSGYSLNTVFYEKKREIRITASPLVGVMPDQSIMIMRRSDSVGRDYEIVVHRPDSPDYQDWFTACDQTMPGGGKQPRRFGWF